MKPGSAGKKLICESPLTEILNGSSGPVTHTRRRSTIDEDYDLDSDREAEVTKQEEKPDSLY
jgi:hypothetical protein